MGAKEARGGFWFQDAKALTRLLADALERRRRQILGVDLDPELRVRIESAVEIVVDPSEPALVEAAPRPVWDGTFTIGDVTVVDECKLGGPARNDRVTFYRRLRATIAVGVPLARLVPRFTVGRGSIEDLDRWMAIGVAAQSATAPGEPPARVDSVQRLAAEAVYYLTTPEPIWKLKRNDDGKDDVPSTPALSLHDARALLSRLEIDAGSTTDDLEAELRRQLEALGASLPIDELVDLLGGWIGRVARARVWHADLTADSLSEKLALVARYIALDPVIERLWHRLQMTKPPALVSMITEQPWRDIQPHVEPVARDRAVNPRIVFTSEGGIGKSHLLAMLFSEQIGTRVWVDAVAELRDVEEAIALGAWAVARTGKALTVFVDAIDQTADPAGLLATIERSLVACNSAVVYVAARFATWADIRDRLPRWRDVRLTHWNSDRIRALAEAGRADPLSADLIDLLRTPLLLDLFLRTFAAGDVIPPGLATRHGVLRAYFERRVYADATAAARRAVLDAGVDAVLANAPAWLSTEPAAQALFSEGVVVRAFGALRFRHVLLRDFSAALQLLPRSAGDIATALRTVESPIVRNELLRGTIEAMLDPDPIIVGAPLAELVRECTHAGLAPGIALGTTDAPTATLLAAIAPLDEGAVMRQALAHAQLIENRAWLRAPAALGGARPDWIGEAQFRGLASLAELALASGDVASGSLAATLRSWTLGQVLCAESWSAATIGALLVRVLPDDVTAEWFANLVLGESGLRGRFLEQLRDLGATAQVSDSALYRALEHVVFDEGSHVLQGGHALWEVTNLCLSDHDGSAGLLTTRPYVALSLMFTLSVERQRIEDRRRAAITPEPALVEMFAKCELPADILEGEARLRLEPTLTEIEALGDLIDDAPATDRHSFDYLEALFDDVEQRSGEDQRFGEQLAGAALASRSVRARIIVLSLAHQGERVADAMGEILRDSRAYHVLNASRPLWDAIQTRWPALSIVDRRIVQQNILARARSPLLSFTSVGWLTSAIPREDLDPTLQPYLEFLETTGRSTTPPRPARVETFNGPIDDDDNDAASHDPAMARLEELARIDNDDLATNQAIALLEHQVGLLAVETSDRSWFAVARVIERDERRQVRKLTTAAARALFEATFGSIEARRADPDGWAILLDIADACPSYVPDAEATEMRTRIIDEVTAGAGERAERDRHAWRALHSLRSLTWFTEGTGGRAVFERWFRDHLHGEGLQAAQRLLPCVLGDVRLELVCHVLETDGRLKGPEGHAFIDDAGRMLAAWSLWWKESFARDRVQRLCETAQRPGALSSAESWRCFVSGFAWSLQNEVRHIAPDPRARAGLARFVPLLELAWSTWRTVIDDAAERNISVGWSVTAPLGHEFTTKIEPPVGGWSSVLRGLLPRVIREGGRNDIGAFQQVDWTCVDPETLRAIADATITRADREITMRPATDWMIDGLIEILARIGRLASLPLVDARRVLDCLQRLGRSAPRANSPAILVEREVRAREMDRDSRLGKI